MNKRINFIASSLCNFFGTTVIPVDAKSYVKLKINPEIFKFGLIENLRIFWDPFLFNGNKVMMPLVSIQVKFFSGFYLLALCKTMTLHCQILAKRR